MKSISILYFLQVICLISLANTASAQSVNPDKATYTEGENISVAFSGGPGNSTDWIAIYSQGVIPDGTPPATIWRYTNGTQSSGGSLTAGNVTFNNPTLIPGNYSVWFLAGNDYTPIAGPTHFTVSEPTPTAPPSWLLASFKRRHGVIGTAYTGKVSAYTNFKGYTFSKTTGPDWLTISATGELGGTPPAGSAGMNSFTIRASNGTANADATMQIEVFAPNTEIVRQLKVMSFNMWHGLETMNNGGKKGLEAIILSGADIIGSQESLANQNSQTYQPQKIADDLGWHYRTDLSSSLGLISRYPISDQTLAAGIARGFKVKVTSSPLQEIILMNAHLDYLSYGPYAVFQSSATEASVLAEETNSQRDEQIAVIMSAMNTMLSNADTTPVLLTGDFNAPSHLDYTAATAGKRNGVGSVAWPTSTAVINAGMKDSFRTLHPNPVTHPGDTWSPVFKGTEPQDRIDFVYYKGASMTPTESIVYTTAVEATVGAWGSDVTPLRNNTWPSDHAAALTTFRLKPIDADTDGLADAFENLHFGNTTSETGAGDADNDGSSNETEQSQGTDPTNAKLFPSTSMIIPTSPDTAPSIKFSLTSLALEKGLVLERSTSLLAWDPLWSYKEDPKLENPLITVTEIEPRKWEATFKDTSIDSTQEAKVFYRTRPGEIIVIDNT